MFKLINKQDLTSNVTMLAIVILYWKNSKSSTLRQLIILYDRNKSEMSFVFI